MHFRLQVEREMILNFCRLSEKNVERVLAALRHCPFHSTCIYNLAEPSSERLERFTRICQTLAAVSTIESNYLTLRRDNLAFARIVASNLNKITDLDLMSGFMAAEQDAGRHSQNIKPSTSFH